MAQETTDKAQKSSSSSTSLNTRTVAAMNELSRCSYEKTPSFTFDEEKPASGPYSAAGSGGFTWMGHAGLSGASEESETSGEK